MSAKWTESDIPDQTGRVALITGANSGIGLEAARALAQHGAHVVLACRNEHKANDAIAWISEREVTGKLEFLALDLSNLDSVAAAAAAFRESHDSLDLLINNAGLMALSEQRTAQGFEMQLGVNHLGHFALTGRLLDLLTSTAGSRVVSISSQGHRLGKIRFDDLQSEKRYSPWGAYFQSKLANLLFTFELQRRLTAAGMPTIAAAAHPGGSRTNLGHEPPGGIIGLINRIGKPLVDRAMQSAAMGALPTLRAATDPAVSGGEYYGPDGFMEQRGHPVKVDSSSRSKNTATAAELWTVSEDLTKIVYEV